MNRNPKIAIVANLKLYRNQIERLQSLGDVEFYLFDCKSEEEWLKRCRGVDIICSSAYGLNSEKLYKLKNVFISLPLVGVEFLNKEKLKENNIVVANAPGCNKEAVAEWIMGMLLMHFRKLNTLNKTTNQNRGEVLQQTTGLLNKQIAILGAGNIGLQLGTICSSFGMKVKFFRRADDIIDTVKEADIIANCLSANNSTTRLLDEVFFSSLKKGAFFISTSRHQTYDVDALLKALNEKRLIGAADDAANAEIGDVNNAEYTKLLHHPKTLVTPHIAWNTDEERKKANDIMIDNIEAWLNKSPINLIH